MSKGYEEIAVQSIAMLSSLCDICMYLGLAVQIGDYRARKRLRY